MRGPRQNSVEYGQNLSKIKLSEKTVAIFKEGYTVKHHNSHLFSRNPFQDFNDLIERVGFNNALQYGDLEKLIIKKVLNYLANFRTFKHQAGEVHDLLSMAYYWHNDLMDIIPVRTGFKETDFLGKFLHSVFEDIANCTNNKAPFVSARYHEFFTENGVIKMRNLGTSMFTGNTEYRGGIEPSKKIIIAPENIVDQDKIFDEIAASLKGTNLNEVMLKSRIVLALQKYKIGSGKYNVDQVLQRLKKQK